MAVVDLWNRREMRSLYGTPDDDPFRYPRTHEEWQERYLYLIDAYNGETYSQELIKKLSLFRALDDNGQVLSLTRRMYRDRIFLVEVASSALALAEATLSPNEDADPEDVARAEAIWKRSKIARVGSRWAKLLAICGDYHVEAVRTVPRPGVVEAVLVGHRPDTVYTVYNALDNAPATATITHSLMGEVSVDIHGRAYEVGTISTYQRTLDADGVVARTMARGESGEPEVVLNQQASGPHSLGSIPLVHLVFVDGTHEGEHGLPVTHGIDRALAEVDSIASQVSAIGDRFANPKLAIFGAKVTEGDKLSLFGRVLNIFGSATAMANVDAKYLEPNLTGASVIIEHMEKVVESIRSTYPEFLFSAGGRAGLSGDALRLLATRYVTKYRQIRHSVYGAMEEAIAKAVALERGIPYDPERHPVKLDGPPLLPADIKAELEALAMAEPHLLKTDVIRRLQSLGLADDEMTPEEYVKRLAEQEGSRADALLTPDPTAPPPLPDDADPFAAPPAPPEEAELEEDEDPPTEEEPDDDE